MAIDYQQAKAIFLDAVHNVPAAGWAAHVRQACPNDAGLLRQVEKLLQAHAADGEIVTNAVESAAAKFAPPSAERVGSLIGPYKILEQIGEGGMGVVYMAQQTRPVKRKVALKVVKPGMDSRTVIARFEAERQALALMDHPNIARVLDAGATESGRPFFVMELVRGIPINEYCDREKLNTQRRLALFIDVCRAVQHAHQKAIIHRDLKPSNVMVTLHDGVPVVKVIDFGVAKALNQELTERTLFTQFSQMIGTPLYMSPEQAELSGLDIDTRSDIYSLGVLLYELLTGTTPFDKERLKCAGFDEIRRIIREEEPETVSTRLARTRSRQTASAVGADGTRSVAIIYHLAPRFNELDWIVARALEKDRNRRYESASAFAADIQRYLNDEPVQACPPSAVYRFRKVARRHRGALITAAVVLFAFICGTSIATWQAIRATRANALAGERLVEVERQRAQAQTNLDEANKARQLADERLLALEREQAITNSPGYRDYLVGVLHSEAQKVRREATGEAADVERLLNEAIKVRGKLAAEFPSDTANREKLAGLYSELSQHIRQEAERQSSGMGSEDDPRLAEADGLISESIRLRRQLAAEVAGAPPTNRNQLAGLLRTETQRLRRLAEAPGAEENPELAARRLAEAEAMFDENIRIRRQVAAENPQNTAHRGALPNTHRFEAKDLQRLAMSAVLKDRPDDIGSMISRASRLYRESTVGAKELVAEFPENAGFAQELIVVMREHAGHLRQQAMTPPAHEGELEVAQRLADADVLIADALQMGRKILADFPTSRMCHESFLGLMEDHWGYLCRISRGEYPIREPEKTPSRMAEHRSLISEGIGYARRLVEVEPREPKHRDRLMSLLSQKASHLRQVASGRYGTQDSESIERHLADAEEHYREAMQVAQQAEADFPIASAGRSVPILWDKARHLIDLADGKYGSVSREQAAQHLAAAEAVYKEALLTDRRLVTDQPNNNDYLNQVCQTLGERAGLLRRMADARPSMVDAKTAAAYRSEANTLQFEYIEIKRRQSAMSPNDDLRRGALVGMLGAQANDFARDADRERIDEYKAAQLRIAAHELHDEAIRIERARPRNDPRWLSNKLAWQLCTKADLFKKQADFHRVAGESESGAACLSEAEKLLREVKLIVTEMIKTNPNEMIFKETLGYCFGVLVPVLEATGRGGEVADLLDEYPKDDASLWPVHYQIIERLVKDGKQEEALAAVNKLIEKQPSIDDYFFQRARIYRSRGDIESALADFNEAIRLDPGNVHAYWNRGDVNAELKKYDQAIADYSHYMDRIQGGISWTYKTRAKSYFQVGEFDKALKDMAAGAEGGDTGALTAVAAAGIMNCPDAAFRAAYVKLVDELVERKDSASAALRARAALRIHQGQLEGALSDYSRGLEITPNDLGLLGSRGDLYVRLKEYDLAIADYTSYLERSGARHISKRRGTARFFVGAYEQAIEDLAVAIKAGDTSTLTWIPLEKIAACPDAAFREQFLRLADDAVEQNPQSGSVRAARGVVRAEMLDFEGARGDFAFVLADSQAPYYPLYQAGLVALKFNDLATFRRVCDGMLERFAETQQPLEAQFTAWTCALAAGGVDDFEPAIAIARRGLERAPTSQQSLTGLGAILYRANQYDEAIATLLKAHAAEATANNSPTYGLYLLAMAHHQVGQFDVAREWLRQADELMVKERDDPANPPKWNRRLTLELLHREAMTLIGTSPGGD